MISKTMPTTEFMLETGCDDSEDLISFCARVSNPSNQSNFETSEKLLRYCIRKKHWSIFEQVDITFEIKCSRAIGRQILRHRSAHFQEFSTRYASPKSDDFETVECRFQDMKNRQSSIEVDDDNMEQRGVSDWWERAQREHIANSIAMYNEAINKGIAKEQARAVFPEGLTPSVMYMKMSLRDWYHYCNLRTGIETQKEHRVIASDIWKQLCDHFEFLSDLKMEIE